MFKYSVFDEENNRIGIKYRRIFSDVNLALLTCHILLFLLYSFLAVKQLMFLNIFSIVLYSTMFIWREKSLKLFILFSYCEVVLQVSSATLIMGWNCGFWLYLFVACAMIFLFDYLFNCEKLGKLIPAFYYTLAFLFFIGLRVFSVNDFDFKKYYSRPVSSGIETTFLFFNALVLIIFFTYFFFCTKKITQIMEEKLALVAETDALTNLPNRFKMKKVFDNFSDSNTDIAISIMDIDDFKIVNDTYGHSVGDDVLCELAKRLRERQRLHFFSCRWGGEEFLLIKSGDNAFDQLNVELEKIRAEISTVNFYSEEDDNFFNVTISIGSALRKSGERLSDTLIRADRSLYRAKRMGKNQLIINDE
ncbi:MAG: GGDEF domain-containing protein [Treponema sp.]|nr:GGDEF domain-containing protein [Treponema sp.]